MRYFTSGDSFLIITQDNREIPHLHKDTWRVADMGTIGSKAKRDTVIGPLGQELFKWMYDKGFKEVKEEEKLAKLMLIYG